MARKILNCYNIKLGLFLLIYTHILFAMFNYMFLSADKTCVCSENVRAEPLLQKKPDNIIPNIIKSENKHTNFKSHQAMKILAQKLKECEEKVPEPSLIYEQSRRRVINSVKFFWENFLSKTKELTESVPDATDEITELVVSVRGFKIFCMSHLEQLSRNDGYDTWRKKEAQELRKKLEKRLRAVQNPTNCENRKIVKCYPYTNLQGWGSTLHHLAECMTIAHYTDRTMIFNSSGFAYNQTHGFGDILEPFSETCTKTTTGELEPEPIWPENNNSRVVSLSRNILRKVFDTSGKLPKDISARVLKLSDTPMAWFLGHLIDLTVRYTPKVQDLVKKFLIKFGIQKPFVGVHIRRTDKLKVFRPHSVENYMRHVEEYFEQLEMYQKVDKRRIYLATEEPDVIAEVKRKYPNYQVYSNIEAARISKNLNDRWSTVALLGMIVDIHLLSMSDYIVCTYSSNVCILINEYFQVNFPDTTNKIVSLDTMYFTDFRLNIYGVAIQNHTALFQGEIPLRTGDKIIIFRGNNRDGYYRCVNLRIKKGGFVPMYKIDVITSTFDAPELK